MADFRSFPADHRRMGRFVESLHDGSRVFLEVSERNRHPRGNELVKMQMDIQMGRPPASYYVKEPTISLFFERRQRIDVEILPQGYRYGRYFERSLRRLCETVADVIVPRPRALPEDVEQEGETPSPFRR